MKTFANTEIRISNTKRLYRSVWFTSRYFIY